MARICNILVVESHEGIRSLLGEALDAQGYKIRLLQGGEEMRRALSETECDIVIIDVSSHREDGFALAEDASRSGASVLLTTADPAQFKNVEESGHHYMLKPFMMPEFLALIRQVADEVGCAHRRTRRRRA